MSINEERLRILKMVEEGKISIEEANELLAAMDLKPDTKDVPKKTAYKFIKIFVQEEGKEQVNIKIPFSLAKTALKFIPKSAKEKMAEKELNLDKLLEAFDDEMAEDKTLVNINEGDTQVLIKLE